MPNHRKKAKINLPAGISYRQAAQALGVSANHVWQVCLGKRRSASLEARLRDYIAKLETETTSA